MNTKWYYKETDPNEPVNPTGEQTGHTPTTGLTKRELISAMIVQGMVSNSEGINRVWLAAKALNPNDLEGAATDAVEDHITERSVSLADALIKRLNRT